MASDHRESCRVDTHYQTVSFLHAVDAQSASMGYTGRLVGHEPDTSHAQGLKESLLSIRSHKLLPILLAKHYSCFIV